jgi:hypothetical protein
MTVKRIAKWTLYIIITWSILLLAASAGVYFIFRGGDAPGKVMAILMGPIMVAGLSALYRRNRVIFMAFVLRPRHHSDHLRAPADQRANPATGAARRGWKLGRTPSRWRRCVLNSRRLTDTRVVDG